MQKYCPVDYEKYEITDFPQKIGSFAKVSTYIPTDECWLYLTGIKDLFNGERVGYAMNERMTKSLVIQALFRATASKHPDKGLIAHSDRGSQYCAHDYQNLLQQFGMIASMSRKGDCYDNAPMESFWGILKTELVHHRRFKTRQQAIQEITYMDTARFASTDV